MSTSITRRNDAKSVAREPYAWPGGYPRYLTMSDGESLCPSCVKANLKRVLEAARDPFDTSGWCPMGADVNWEDDTLYCAHCSERIPSAYGDDDDIDDTDA